jgi:hypothetical protein
MTTPTPRTDFATDLSGWVTAGFARTLERELAAALIENEKQARLLGSSAERECDLRGKVERLKRELAALRERYEYAEISLPAELIPATRAASKEEAK